MSKFIDLVEITVQAGRGGDGKVAWRREKYEPHGGPYGGDGGKGSSVWIQATNSLNTLLDFRFKREFTAPNGAGGESARRSGKSAEDLVIKVPVGTVVSIVEEDGEVKVLGDLHADGERLLVAKGGRGGRGNQHFATSTRQAPHFCEPGQDGQFARLKLELKLVAHIGIIGMPNAGKSTLISRLSAAKPKIADYPFTTLTPNLGIIQYGENKSLTIADIPGLIEGASEGIGLGFHFLRHIERTRALIHLIDGATEEPEACLKAYEMVRTELQKYNPKILEKQEILLINKADSIDEDHKEKINQVFGSKKISFISAVTGEGIQDLKNQILQMYDSVKEEAVFTPETTNIAEIRKTDDFEIEFDLNKGVFKVDGSFIEGLLRVTNFRDQESVEHLYNQLKKVKLFEELEKCGIKTGDTVLVGNREMVWSHFADDKLI